VLDPFSGQYPANRTERLEFQHLVIGEGLERTTEIRIPGRRIRAVTLDEQIAVEKVCSPAVRVEEADFLWGWHGGILAEHQVFSKERPSRIR
jgi:hypothetical protein